MSPNGIVGIIEEIGKEVSKVIVVKTAKDLYKHIKVKFRRREKDLKLILSKSQTLPKKLFLIGAGEIGVEICLSSIQDMNWYVGSVDEVKKGSTIERMATLIRNTLKKDTKETKGIMSQIGDSYLTKVQRTLPSFQEKNAIDKIKNYIYELNGNNKIIIMEDYFLSPEQWKTLCREYGSNPKYHFAPPPEYCEYFLDKIKMKELIKEIKGENHIVDTEKIILDIKKKTIEKCRTFLDKHGQIILKPSMTSSGWGQSIITHEKDIPSAIKSAKQLARIKSNEAILERKVGDFVEAAIFIFKSVNNPHSSVIMGPFEYSETVVDPIGGPVRLNEIRYPVTDERICNVNDQLVSIATEIGDKVSAPFLGVEYIIEKTNIFVNELVWRPEDIGMITLLSHRKSQYKLFLESFQREKILNAEPREGRFVCFSIRRKKGFPHTPPENLMMKDEEYNKIHFYNKLFPKMPTEKIVGYAIFNEVNDDNKTLVMFKKKLRGKLAKEFGGKENIGETFIF